MKAMTCRQLGGCCDHEFRAETFDEISAMSQAHGKEMVQQGDQPHIKAMNEMMDLMSSPDAMHEWMRHKLGEFNALPDVS